MGKVTTRNFYETKFQCFHIDTQEFGVPKGTFPPLFSANTSNQNKEQYEPKMPLFLSKMPVFTQDTTGHEWTSNSGKRLRISYEVTFQEESFDRFAGTHESLSILSSTQTDNILNHIIKTTSREFKRGRHARNSGFSQELG